MSCAPAPLTAVELIAELNQLLDATLAPLVPAGARVALLDFPNHNNVGDNAIWLGELAYLERRGAEIAYVCDLSSFCADALRARLDDGIILLHGGGSFGSLWPRHQAFRERVVSDFPQHRIVQLPQTVDFTNEPSLERARRVFGAHRDFVALVRDHDSLGVATGRLGLRAVACPDMAFALGALARRPPAKDILWLARTDHEAASPRPAPNGGGVEVVDWLRGEPGRPWSHGWAAVTVRSRRAMATLMERQPSLRRGLTPFLGVAFEQLAERRLRRGLRILSRGRVVVTDRLHGHVLSLLLGIPHVLLDNRFGKVTRFHRTFTSTCSLARRASDPEEALEVAREMVREDLAADADDARLREA